ncbi:hypothetical protein [Roseobacter sp. HKCCA0434]|uniref:hypothetical protein n=1 Tax=Roseobacter sp. HKCCA0434 TaxID=3079297 RepID=UPI002905DEC8|nr:hypothetical protein [Roseobacter sp. HKCCA0434]
MKGRIGIWIAFVAMVAPGFAQPLIRSGEHASFTRLVIEADTLPQWKAVRRGREVQIELAAEQMLALPSVFDRIGRRRVASVDWADGVLSLGLACDCAAQVTSIDDKVLVIDVRDGGSAAVFPGPDLVEIHEEQAGNPDVTDAGPQAEVPDVQNATGAGEDERVRAALIEQLRAAQRRSDIVLREDLSASPHPPPRVPDVLLEPRPDIARRGSTAPRSPREQGACGVPLGEEEVRPAEDQPHRVGAATEETVIYLLAWGLGAEAEAMIRAASPPLGKASVYLAIARLLDDRPAGPALIPYEDCDGAIGVWARIARTDPRGKDVEILASFASDYRRMVAPYLADSFLQANVPDQVAPVVALAARDGVEPSDLLRFLQGRAARALGEDARARRIWLGLSAEGGLTGALAQLELAELALAEGDVLSDGAQLDLAALAFELRGTRHGRHAVELLARHHAARGALTASLDILKARMERDDVAADVYRQVALELIRITPADHADFARAVLRHADLIPVGGSGDATRLSAASGLIQLGLPTAARELLAPQLSRSDARAQTLLSSVEHRRHVPRGDSEGADGPSDATHRSGEDALSAPDLAEVTALLARTSRLLSELEAGGEP